MKIQMVSKLLFGVAVVGVLLGLAQGLGYTFIAQAIMVSTLVLIGLGIGTLNIDNTEKVSFMIATLSLGSVGLLTTLVLVGNVLAPAFANLSAVCIPAGIVVAVKTIYKTAKN